MPMTVVHELALYECPALELEAQPDEERRHRFEVRDGDADMVERRICDMGYILQDLLVSWAAWRRSPLCRWPSHMTK
jgi:hypothetical protein